MTGELFRIERATARDRDDVIRLLLAQLQEHGIATPEAEVARAVDGVLADRSRGCIVVAHDRASLAPATTREAIAVAYVSFVWSLEHGGHAAWLEELYVLPERREGGVGTALLHAVTGICRTEKCAALDLEVESSHARVSSLYEREGFAKHTRARWFKKL